MNVFLPKEDQELPDFYMITLHYNVGGKDEIEAVSHQTLTDTLMIQIVSKEDLWMLIPIDSIKKMEFDKRFSKIMALREKQIKKAG